MSMDQSVIEAKRIGVFNCHVGCKLVEAAALMRKEDISALVVVDDDGCLAGIISRVDLLRAWMNSPGWQNETVQAYMNPEVISVTPETRLFEVARLLLEQHIHRVVVVRSEGDKISPISVVSAADLIYHMADIA
jgi:signal-transduction protein with cAMP-binding, CBS, and nucleotidyltransferase domain